jgi:ribosome maturation factor RimP
LTEVLAEKPSLFLIDLVTDAFKVIITLDDDNGVVLQDCIDISRAIDLSLDRKSKIIRSGFSRVSSPLKKIRQYKKNIGRTLIVKTNTENIEAELVEANDDFVILRGKQESLRR